MNVTAESYGHAVLMNIEGELTADTIAAFKKSIDHQLEDSQVIDVVLNMENVPFVDSESLEYLLGLQEQLAERFGQVKLSRIDENIGKILEITRLDAEFDVYDKTSDAVKAVQA